MYNLNSLGETIRTIRELKTLLLRQVAAYLEIDTTLISKTERGERRLIREQEIKLAKFYNKTDELETIENEPFAMQELNKVKTIFKTLI